MSPIRDTLPVTPPETLNSYLPSQPLLEDWMIPQSKPDSAPFFASPPNDAFQQEGFMPAPWALPQDEEKFRPWESKTYVKTGRDTTLSWMIPPAPSRLAQGRKHSTENKQTLQRQKRPKARKRRIPIWMAMVSIIAVVVIVLTQGNGIVGAWTADEFRAIAGPVAAAQVEALYLNAQNTAYSWEYQLGLHHVAAPFQVKSTVIKSAKPTKTTLKPMPLTSMKSLISPALNGEGVWNILEAAPHTYSYLPLDAKAFIRPDPTIPYAVVSLLQFDARFMRLHIVSGTQEPGGTLGAYGPGIIPQADQEGNALLATLNGGFKYADGSFGLMTDGKVFVPPQQNAATIAITKSGKLIIGAWGTDPRLNNNNNDLAAWRQNAGLLINNGEVSALTKDGAAWGGTILNSEYTWRSGLGVTAEGNLIYAAGNALLPETLGKALKAAGAVMAMETDINPFWARAFLYQQDTSGALTISKLSADMQGTGKEYLTANQRDFFYLTRYTPAKTSK
jgi:Phosphodiester glycosidase